MAGAGGSSSSGIGGLGACAGTSCSMVIGPGANYSLTLPAGCYCVIINGGAGAAGCRPTSNTTGYGGGGYLGGAGGGGNGGNCCCCGFVCICRIC